jgi:hypothetical protein
MRELSIRDDAFFDEELCECVFTLDYFIRPVLTAFESARFFRVGLISADAGLKADHVSGVNKAFTLAYSHAHQPTA